MRKKLAILSTLLLVLLLSGCLNWHRDVKLTLQGFPPGGYTLKIYATNDLDDGKGLGKLIAKKEVNADEVYTNIFRAPVTFEFIVAYLEHHVLFSDELDYICVFYYDPSVSTYAGTYWKDYHAWKRGQTVYVISERNVKKLDSGTSEELDFEHYPYYIYEVDNPQGRDTSIKLNVSKGSVQIGYAQDISRLDYGLSTWNSQYGMELDYSVYNWAYEKLFIMVRPENYTPGAEATINITPGTPKNLIQTAKDSAR